MAEAATAPRRARAWHCKRRSAARRAAVARPPRRRGARHRRDAALDDARAARARTPLLALVDAAAAGLEADNRELAQSVQQGLAASPAAEWLLDNYYLIEEQVLLVREDLPRHYATELPRLTDGPARGLSRASTRRCSR